MNEATSRLAVVGAGVMGTSITAMAIGHGAAVTLIDLSEDILRRATGAIDQQRRHGQLLGAFPDGPAGELTTSTSLDDVAGCAAVIEAVPEFPKVKRAVIATASAIVTPGVPIITNTSGIPISELADAAERADELMGTHFMNPAYLISMVEVIRGPQTSAAVLDTACSLLAALGREAVIVSDTPGFVTSRLLHPMINTAALVVEQGTTSVEGVDRLMQGCLGHPTGPLRTADLIGLDNLVDSLNALYERTGDSACRPCELLVAKVKAGDLGRKSGRGFYDYGRNSS